MTNGATESGKVTYVPSKNTNADCFEDRGAIFNVSKDIYEKQGIEVTTPDIQCLQI
jgi:hypothetical protein